jgi:hypothetical protein
MKLEMKWQNIGSAPCYEPYCLAYRLTDGEEYSRAFIGSTTVDEWMPGSVDVFTEQFLREPPELPPGEITEVTEHIELTSDMSPGRYRLAIGVVNKDSHEPIVRLAIKGRTEDGWYPLSEAEVIK